VEIYREHGRGIDLVVLDLIMPEMGGGETFDKLKELDPDVAVLLSSGYSLNGDAADVIAKGCRGFIQKPFGLDQLSEQLRRILDERCDKDQGTSST
jgi:DNA-binding NtrC family response regulator